MSAKHERATIMLRESNKKILNIKKENDKLKDNINLMQTEIADKSSIIAQLEATNTRFHNNITELCSRGKLLKKEVELEGESREIGGKEEMFKTNKKSVAANASKKNVKSLGLTRLRL